MNTMNKKHLIIPIALAVAAFGFTSCSETSSTETSPMERQADQMAQELRADMDKASEELAELRDRAKQQVDRLDSQLNEDGLDALERERLTAEKADLENQVARLDNAIDEVGNATNTTWESVKTSVNSTASDIKAWFERQAEAVEEAVEGGDSQQ